jgi:hypothetical protein
MGALIPTVPSWQLKHASETPTGVLGIEAFSVGLLYIVNGPVVV